MGIRSRITLGFASLAVLLLVAGGITLFELNRARIRTDEIVELGIQNSTFAERMTSALQAQNGAVLESIALRDPYTSDSFFAGSEEFRQVITEMISAEGENTEIADIRSALGAYEMVLENFRSSSTAEEIDKFTHSYMIAYHSLDNAVKNYIISPNTAYGRRTGQLEGSFYKTITPSILTLLITLLLVLIFYFFVDTYYVRPVLKINEALKLFVTKKIPYNLEFENSGEIGQLNGMIEELVRLSREQCDKR